VFDAFDAPRACWAPPDADDWALATSGEVARIEACGAERFALVRERGTALLERIHVRTVGAAAQLSPRLVGGFAFAPRTSSEGAEPGPWSAWADASFVLPRWTYATRASSAVLMLTLAAGELSDAAAWGERLDAVLAMIGRAASDRDRSSERAPGGRQHSSRLPETCAVPVRAEPFVATVEQALVAIRSKRFDKVVVSADAKLLADADIDAAGVLGRLFAAYPETTRFALSRGPATFVGATPERLVDRRGRRIEIDALAGTVARSAQPEEDEALARSLLGSAKELEEHRVVVHAIREVLEPLCAELVVPEHPQTRPLRNVRHLWTVLRGRLNADLHVLELVERMHPTPAVAGFPRRPALSWLAEHEPRARGWYAGPVGWFDRTGEGSFAVALRCGLIEHRRAWVFAGAGIVEGSDPSRELAEVRAKQRAVLSALGVAP
jgi:menaquinone-specific isochorismate synthase